MGGVELPLIHARNEQFRSFESEKLAQKQWYLRDFPVQVGERDL